ncbi:hypothetical protein DLAC_00533 [Tieghemostelium lacteum]|uniref:Uncharacterized protein n=1 Tax=Tieghemostelium lacteum TaxID=361077 RepID=A0A152A9Z1_TIELA|nr:hypothetical protein DLAC_00533 [Tieghemostelium lacteum]|eukprot:KYR03042.1 hypothetical protein DLAC_00533 [Tieghemostelium lacteum]
MGLFDDDKSNSGSKSIKNKKKIESKPKLNTSPFSNSPLFKQTLSSDSSPSLGGLAFFNLSPSKPVTNEITETSNTSNETFSNQFKLGNVNESLISTLLAPIDASCIYCDNPNVNKKNYKEHKKECNALMLESLDIYTGFVLPDRVISFILERLIRFALENHSYILLKLSIGIITRVCHKWRNKILPNIFAKQVFLVSTAQNMHEYQQLHRANHFLGVDFRYFHEGIPFQEHIVSLSASMNALINTIDKMKQAYRALENPLDKLLESVPILTRELIDLAIEKERKSITPIEYLRLESLEILNFHSLYHYNEIMHYLKLPNLKNLEFKIEATEYSYNTLDIHQITSVYDALNSFSLNIDPLVSMKFNLTNITDGLKLLQRVSLEGIHVYVKEIVELITVNYSNIVDLSLLSIIFLQSRRYPRCVKSNATSKQITKVFKSLHNHPTLRKLIIYHSQPMEMETIVGLLNNCPKMKSIDLNVNISVQSYDHVITNSTLEKLDFKINGILQPMIFEMWKTHSHITSLNVTCQEVFLYANVRNSNEPVKDLDKQHMYSLYQSIFYFHLSHLQHLGIFIFKRSDEISSIVNEIISFNCQNLTSLTVSISNDDFYSKSISMRDYISEIFRSIARNHHLTDFQLLGNILPSTLVEEFLDSSHPSIKNVTFDYITKCNLLNLSKSLQKNRTIQRFKINCITLENVPTVSDYSEFAQIFRYNHILERFEIPNLILCKPPPQFDLSLLQSLESNHSINTLVISSNLVYHLSNLTKHKFIKF